MEAAGTNVGDDTAAGSGEFQLTLLREFELHLDGRPLRPCVGEQRLVALLAVRGMLPQSVVSGPCGPTRTSRARRATCVPPYGA
jgi:hypothetical protein